MKSRGRTLIPVELSVTAGPRVTGAKACASACLRREQIASDWLYSHLEGTYSRRRVTWSFG